MPVPTSASPKPGPTARKGRLDRGVLQTGTEIGTGTVNVRLWSLRLTLLRSGMHLASQKPRREAPHSRTISVQVKL